MAFFGVTGAGPQNAFHAASTLVADLAIFKRGDFERAFHRVSRRQVEEDGVEREVLHRDDARTFMSEVYMGEYPEAAAVRLEKALEDDATDAFGFEELYAYLQRLADEDDKDITKEGGRHLQEEGKSMGFLLERRKRGVRPLEGPRDELFQPLTAAQEVGWDITTEDVKAARDEIIPTRKCEESKFAAHVFASGEML